MKYWPLSMLKASPLMPAVYAHELYNFYRKMPSEHAFEACLQVARETQPLEMSGLLIIESVNAPLRQTYTEYPTWEEWSRLERAGAYQSSEGYLFMTFEALH